MIRKRQIIKLSILFSLCLILGGSLTACGIKPEFPDAPQGYENDDYPKQYPAKSTNNTK